MTGVTVPVDQAAKMSDSHEVLGESMKFKAVGVFITAVLLAGCSSNIQKSPAPQTAESSGVMYSITYPYYETVEKMADIADLVIRGTPISVEVEQLIYAAIEPTSDDPILNPGGPPVTPSSIVATVYTFDIRDCYKGCSTTESSVQVAVPGGLYEGMQYTYLEATVFQTGTTYILFLATSETLPAALLNAVQAAYSDETDGAGNYISLASANELKISPAIMQTLFPK